MYNIMCISIIIIIIGASLSEPHTYVKYASAVCMCIYIYIKYYTVQVTNLYTDASDSQDNHTEV